MWRLMAVMCFFGGDWFFFGLGGGGLLRLFLSCVWGVFCAGGKFRYVSSR